VLIGTPACRPIGQDRIKQHDPMARRPAPARQPRQTHTMDMSTYVTAAAHDMKNSVCAIAAYLEDALAQMDEGERSADAEAGAPTVRELTHQALYEAQRVSSHLIGIMAVYKINAGIYPFEPEEVELPGFAEEVAARIMPLAATRGVSVELSVDRKADTGYFDRELILAVLLQSLHGAIKYSRDRIRLSLANPAGALEIRVEDNGPGFPDFVLAQGYAERSSIDSRTGSTGLGLYFARLVAQMHRHGGRAGQTRLENGGALGGGCFVLSLP
jgi:signal transduction histidine kinase